MRLTFQPFRSHHKLVEDGQTHRAGDSFDVSDERGAYLLEHHGDVLTASPSALESLKRDELNTLARESGVLGPEELPNKQAVIAAIEHAD